MTIYIIVSDFNVYESAYEKLEDAEKALEVLKDNFVNIGGVSYKRNYDIIISRLN